MSMKMATVEILIEKARFEPQIAVAIAEAMDEAMEAKVRESQWVTVPILDARLADLKGALLALIHGVKGELRAETHGMRSELCEEMHGMKSELRAEIHEMKGELRAEMHSMKSELRTEMHGIKGELRAEMHSMKSDILRHLYGVILGQSALWVGLIYFLVLHGQPPH